VLIGGCPVLIQGCAADLQLCVDTVTANQGYAEGCQPEAEIAGSVCLMLSCCASANGMPLGADCCTSRDACHIVFCVSALMINMGKEVASLLCHGVVAWI
jgi:hypothetical protein